MRKRWSVVGLLLAISVVVVGCGVPQEEHDTAVAELNAAQAELSSLKGELTRVQTDLAAAKSDLTERRTDLLEARSQISSLQSQIPSLQSQLSGAQARVAGLEGLIAALAPVTYRWQIYSDRPPFNDDRLRRAICMILDEEEIAGLALPGKNVHFEAEQEWASGVNDLVAAKTLMWEAGYPYGFRLTIPYAPMGDEGIDDLVAFVKASLSAVGIAGAVLPITSIEALPRGDFVLIVKRVP